MQTSVTDVAHNQVNKAWGLSETTLTVIKQSENHTYMVQSSVNDKRYILRLTPQDHRSQSAIQSELDYILMLNHQAQEPLHLCPPIQLASGDEQFIALIQPYDDGKEWFAVLFEYARGSAVLDKWRGLTDDSLIAALGRAMGTMHRIVAEKGDNAAKWKEMEKNVPQCSETHGGATDISRVRSRAEAGHEPSQLLLNIWESKIGPFLDECEKTDLVYGVIHGDVNVSNYFAEQIKDSLPGIWIFDFDQLHHNFFGFDVGVVLQMIRFFEEDGLGIGKIDGFDADRFRTVFVSAYEDANPAMVSSGHMSPDKLATFELYREFFHAGVAVDILFQAQNGKQFESAITGFCEIVVKRFRNKFC